MDLRSTKIKYFFFFSFFAPLEQKRKKPFFCSYGTKKEKKNRYQQTYLMKDKAHLTFEGLEQIRVIKSGMNKGR